MVATENNMDAQKSSASQFVTNKQLLVWYFKWIGKTERRELSIWVELKMCLLKWVWFQQRNRQSGFKCFSTRVWLCMQTHTGLISFVFIHFTFAFQLSPFPCVLVPYIYKCMAEKQGKHGKWEVAEVNSCLSSVSAKSVAYVMTFT